jgi:hypothetical protein
LISSLSCTTFLSFSFLWLLLPLAIEGVLNVMCGGGSE